MARKPRIEFEGALYHVIGRGNRKEAIFLDDEDRQHFLTKLKDYKRQYGFILYAYVLMKNHLHLLIETGRTPLSKIMQGLLQSHTQWHNRKYHLVGHLFQGRYKAILCDKDTYLLELLRYLHLNPLRAGYRNPLKYPWSSHHIYLVGQEDGLVCPELVLSLFDRSKRKALTAYEDFINDGFNEGARDDFYQIKDQRILGDDDFYEGVMNRVHEPAETRGRMLKDKTLAEISATVAELYGITKAELRSKTRDQRIVKARSIFIRLSRLSTNSLSKDIAKYLNRQPSTIIGMIRATTESDFDTILERLGW